MHSSWKACPHANMPEDNFWSSSASHTAPGGVLSSRQIAHVMSIVFSQCTGSGCSSTGTRARPRERTWAGLDMSVGRSAGIPYSKDSLHFRDGGAIESDIVG